MNTDKKQAIVQAATKSFALFGYKATTMEQVAKMAKVGKGTVYLYFPTKEHLLKEIIQNTAEKMTFIAKQYTDTNKSFIENIQLLLEKIMEFREQHELTIKLYQEVNEIGTPEVIEALNDLEQKICKFIETNIIKAIEKGEIRPCHPKLTAFLMFKTYITLLNDWNKQYEPISIKEIAALINNYFILGLRAK